MSKKALKKNAAYWRGRFTALENKRYRKTAEYYDKVKRIFSHAEVEAKDKLAAWYNRLAVNNEISYADAFKLLKADELEEFHWTVQEYIDRGKNVGLDPKWEKQLENASAKVHVSRLEEIQTELKATVENLYSEYETGTAAHLSSIANDSYYHTAYEVAKGTGIGTTLHRLDSRTLTKLLTTPWGKDEEDFSDRIWQRRDKLIQTLNDELAHNLILGLDPQKSIDKIAEDFEVDKRAAGRLVMTESAAIGSMAREASLKELEVEEFEIVATLDSHTSTICQQMDGQHFPMSKFKVGTTAPPFHPNCRSTTVPYFNDEFTADETRAARDANDKGYERVPSDMTYKEWKGKYVKEISISNPEIKLSTRPNSSITPKQQYEDTMTVLSVFHELPEKVRNRFYNVGFEFGYDCSACDLNNMVIRVGMGASKEEINHEFGHLIEKYMMSKKTVQQYKDYLVATLGESDIIKEVYYDTVGNPVEIFVLKGDRFVSEYQSRIYVSKPEDALNKDGTINTYFMPETISEPFRMYMNGEPLAEEVKKLLERVIL